LLALLEAHHILDVSRIRVKAGNLEGKRMDEVGEGKGQMPPMRKGGERIPSI